MVTALVETYEICKYLQQVRKKAKARFEKYLSRELLAKEEDARHAECMEILVAIYRRRSSTSATFFNIMKSFYCDNRETLMGTAAAEQVKELCVKYPGMATTVLLEFHGRGLLQSSPSVGQSPQDKSPDVTPNP